MPDNLLADAGRLRCIECGDELEDVGLVCHRCQVEVEPKYVQDLDFNLGEAGE